jgi:hypothetical protein
MTTLHICPIKDATSTRSHPGGVVITGLRGRHQLDKFSCGAAAVATTLCAYSGDFRKTDWKVILDACRPSVERGTPVRRLIAGLRSSGLEYTKRKRMHPSEVKNCLSRGDLIITTTSMPRQGEDATHWVVIAGATDSDALILNHTGLPLHTRRWIPWSRMMSDGYYQPFVVVHTKLKEFVSDRRHEAIRSARAS